MDFEYTGNYVSFRKKSPNSPLIAEIPRVSEYKAVNPDISVCRGKPQDFSGRVK